MGSIRAYPQPSKILTKIEFGEKHEKLKEKKKIKEKRINCFFVFYFGICKKREREVEKNAIDREIERGARERGKKNCFSLFFVVFSVRVSLLFFMCVLVFFW